jgi:hypothetical protein
VILALYLAGVAVAAPLVLVFGHRRLLAEFEILLAVVAGGTFVMLAWGLYSGAHVRKREDVAGELKMVGGGAGWAPDALPDLADIGSGCAGDGGCLDWVAALLLALVLMVVLAVGLWLFVNVALIVFFLLATAVGWVLQRALRQVFARSRRCRGDLAASLAYAGWYTLLYTGWLFAALALADRLVRGRG